MSKLETSGYKRFWPMRELQGINPDGSKQAIEGYRDMLSGEFYAPENGWNGCPPDLPDGEKIPDMNSDLFRKNYEATFGHS